MPGHHTRVIRRQPPHQTGTPGELRKHSTGVVCPAHSVARSHFEVVEERSAQQELSLILGEFI